METTQHQDNCVTVNFQIKAACTQWGQTLAIVGDVHQLGNWTLCQQLKLEPSSFPLWTTSISLPPATDIRYKYIVVETNGTDIAHWELCENRSMTTAEAGAAMIVKDTQFGQHRQHMAELVCLDVDGQTSPTDNGDQETIDFSSPKSLVSVTPEKTEKVMRDFSLLTKSMYKDNGSSNESLLTAQGEYCVSVSLSSLELSSDDLQVPNNQEADQGTAVVTSALSEARKTVDQLRQIIATWHTTAVEMAIDNRSPESSSNSREVSTTSSTEERNVDISAIDNIMDNLVSEVEGVLKDVLKLRSTISSVKLQTLTSASSTPAHCENNDTDVDMTVGAEPIGKTGSYQYADMSLYVSGFSIVCFILCALLVVLHPYVHLDTNLALIRGSYFKKVSLAALKQQVSGYFST